MFLKSWDFLIYQQQWNVFNVQGVIFLFFDRCIIISTEIECMMKKYWWITINHNLYHHVLFLLQFFLLYFCPVSNLHNVRGHLTFIWGSTSRVYENQQSPDTHDLSSMIFSDVHSSILFSWSRLDTSSDPTTNCTA